MTTGTLKENARKSLKRNHWLSVAVAFFMTLGASTIPTFGFSNTFSFDFSNGSYDFSQTFPQIFHSLETLPFNSFIILVIIVVCLLIAAVAMVLKALVFNIFTVGGSRFFLKLRKNQPVDFGEVFQNFRDKTYLNIAKTTFIRDVYVALFSILFIIPGIIKSYEYWAVNYILAVRPDLSHKEALYLSSRVMKGKKLDLFVLQLSFIGWNLLSIFTCSILNLLYVAPYMQATYAEFFADVRDTAIANGVISPFDIPDYEQHVAPESTTPFYSTSYGMNTYTGGFAQQETHAQPENPTQPENPAPSDNEQ